MIKINNKASCSACAACAGICPEQCIFMDKDKLGFAYPRVDMTKCIECGLCADVCQNTKKAQDRAGLPVSYAAQSMDDDFRNKSSSGGLFAVFAQYIISQNGVVFGAAFDNTFRRVRHISIETMCDFWKIQGSKYVQSDTENSYREVKAFLKEGRTVLFSGTLCQIAGLRAFLGKDYENLYLIDVVCHGVPSPFVWSSYIDFLQKKYGGKVTDVSFRDKRYGWKDYVISIKFDNGKEYVNNRAEDLYMRGFLHNCYLRPACFKCAYKGLTRASDITLGDLWGVEGIAPELDDNRGTSLVMICSEKGRAMFEKIVGGIKHCSVNTDIAVKYNPAITECCRESAQSSAFEKEYGTKTIEKILKKYCANSVVKKIIRKIVGKQG